ncbi:hypothetical protein RchiOBHm_Chr6g0254561 [Rosa chinensis]|uniref:Uncharacterized protein n=1 Tax=Rosa chinensis TaxID=74649 RepID=A0A2P6PLM3_ROSCH|nr:uncharacterized protein LOC112170215 [Rosa chinensis]XP_024163188.1 uncharacterized protein LOC112170215 [Rosa chinensis]PRQ22835.1 hypothetical protein RchiOBHm_Chr6g0254561 [Rosa chinensis]
MPLTRSPRSIMISLTIDDAVGLSFACLCLRPAGWSWLADLTFAAPNFEALSLFGKMGGKRASLKSGKMAVGGVKSQKFDLKSQSAKTKSLTKEDPRKDLADLTSVMSPNQKRVMKLLQLPKLHGSQKKMSTAEPASDSDSDSDAIHVGPESSVWDLRTRDWPDNRRLRLEFFRWGLNPGE